jgi:hypothetical protein
VWRLAAVAFVLMLAGCAAVPTPRPADPELAECVQRFERADRAIAAAGVQDARAARVEGFPWLRADRFLASFAQEAQDGARFDDWIGALGELDRRARGAELWNGWRANAIADAQALDACRARLIGHDAATPARRDAVRTAVRAPDEYLSALRVAGLYPVSSLFMRRGVARWHAEAARVFATPLEALPVQGTLLRWSAQAGPLPSGAELRAVVEASRDALGVPRPGAADARRLLDAFAPVWEVDAVDAHDRIGAPQRVPAAGVDATRPVEYRMLAHTRRGDAVLLQLVYGVWFAGRPGEDMYAGALDGLVWRVTLGEDGAPLVHDSIHACGCYHQFFPSSRLRLRSDLPRRDFEPPLVPQPAPPGGPLVVRLAAGTHYIERVYADGGERTRLPLVVEPHDGLAMGGSGVGERGLFDANGLVPGSERPERFLLWTSGVRSPGAMRQWGRHATAFVGRRHFDDARLLDVLFEETD